MERRIIHEFEAMASKFEIIEFPDSCESRVNAVIAEYAQSIFLTNSSKITGDVSLDIITDNNIVSVTLNKEGFIDLLEKAIKWYKKREKEKGK